MHDFSIHSCTLSSLILLYLLVNVTFSAKVQPKREVKYGRASLVLYQGKVRHEIEGAHCPVGISFVKPERFSCACVNGVWAFYNVMCDYPLAVIGGHNYCFQMPESYIQQVAVISNPLRPLDDTLAIFDGEQESVHTKVYRNLHLPIDNADFFLALNSSWTLKGTDGSQELCLNSQYITHVDDPSFLKAMYCNFENISTLMPSIGAIYKGCNDSSRKIEPTDCQPLLAPNSEGICTSALVLEAYDLLEKESKENPSLGEFKRKWKHMTTTPSTSTTTRPTKTKLTTTPTPEITVNINTEDDGENSVLGRRMVPVKPKGRQLTWTTPEETANATLTESEEEEKQNQIAAQKNKTEVTITEEATSAPVIGVSPSKEPGGSNRTNDTNTTTSSPISEVPTEGPGEVVVGVVVLSAAQMIEKMNDLWNNKEFFLVPPLVESEPEVMDQIWKYEKMNIQNSLGLSVNDSQSPTSQIVSLIQISKDIMAKICPIVSEEYFTLALETFLAVQRKSYHWKEPYIAYNDYLRIYAALSACKDRASPFEFMNTKKCIKRNPEKLVIGRDSGNITNININEKIPADFASKGYEPIIESVWKIVVSTHSYCFRDFDDYYNDHHKYTVVLLPTFLNDINKLWFDHRNKVISQEYAGVIGDAGAILADIDKCATATRLISEYPFDLSRPSIDNETDTTDGGSPGGGTSSPQPIPEPPSTNGDEIVTPAPASTNVTPGKDDDSARKMVGAGGKNKLGRYIGSSRSSSRIAKSRKVRSLPDVPEPRENKQITGYTGRKPLQTQRHDRHSISFSDGTLNLRREKKQVSNLKQTVRASIENGIHSPNFGSSRKWQEKRQANGLDWKTLGIASILDVGRQRRTAPISITNARGKKSSTSFENQGKIEAWKKNRLSLNDKGYCLKKYDEPRKFLDQNCDL